MSDLVVMNSIRKTLKTKVICLDIMQCSRVHLQYYVLLSTYYSTIDYRLPTQHRKKTMLRNHETSFGYERMNYVKRDKLNP